MARTGRPDLSHEQKAELWRRWKAGETLSDIGRALDKHLASVSGVVAPKDDCERSVIADSIPERYIQADRPNQKWLDDFAYIWTAESGLNVAVVLGLFSVQVVGWSLKADRDASWSWMP